MFVIGEKSRINLKNYREDPGNAPHLSVLEPLDPQGLFRGNHARTRFRL